MRTKQRRVHRSRFPETLDPIQQKIRHYDGALRVYERGLNWVTKLKSHTSCINAVNFSQMGGRWMVSGGDDLRILLWDLHDTEVKKPQHTFVGPLRNIFELSFTASNKYLLCGGVDSAVRRYDFERIGQTFDPDPMHTFHQHNDSIRGLATHISNDELYMTASQEGRLFFHDTRSPTPAGHMISKQGWVGLQFHPRLEHLFLGATEHKSGRITLFDIRKCFGRDSSSDDKELTRYLTAPISNKPVNSQVCDIAFDRSGERFASVNQGHFPVVYALSDSYPIAVCTAVNRPNGEPVLPTERNYGNSCTIKHVSFGGPSSSFPSTYSSDKTASTNTDQFIATGSDDFRGYVWAIPSTSYLLDKRREIEEGEDHPIGQFGYKYSAIDTLCVPVHLDTPAFRLGGHQSIVNTARWHPTLPRIASCGIESKVVLHDCTQVLKGAELVGSDKVRKRAGKARRWRTGRGDEDEPGTRTILGETSEEISEDEDQSTIRYFDNTLIAEEEERRALAALPRRRRQLLDDSDGESSEDWTGGAGGIDESADAMSGRADRARLMAMFSRILAAAARRDEDEDNEDGDGDGPLNRLLMLAAADGLGDLDEEEGGDSEGDDMDTSE